MKKRIQYVQRYGCNSLYKIQYSETRFFLFFPYRVWQHVLELVEQTTRFGDKYYTAEHVSFIHAERAEYILRNTSYEDLRTQTKDALSKETNRPYDSDSYKYVE